MHAPGIRTRRALRRTAAPAAVLLAGLMVWQGSNAAFSAETYNAGNNWSAGTVTLTDDDMGAAAFTVTNVTPGDTGEKCILVTSGSTVKGLVKTYIKNLEIGQSKGLEKYIKIQILEGTGGTFNDCTDFVPSPVEQTPAAFLDVAAAAMHDYGTGGHPWVIAGTPPEKKSYKAIWSFDTDTAVLSQAAVDALQGGSVRVDFEWELQDS